MPTTRDPGKGWDALVIRDDLEDLVEPGVLEDVLQVAADAREAELAPGGEQPLLGLQQHAEARARDVLELAAVHGDGPLDPIEKRLGLGRLRGVETPRDHDRRV